MPNAVSQLNDVFGDSFMHPEIYFGGYFEVETKFGSEIVPADVIGRTCGTAAEAFANYVEGEISDPDECVEYRQGWLCRLSASGYMDCTDWSAFETEEEAAQYLIDIYGDDLE